MRLPAKPLNRRTVLAAAGASVLAAGCGSGAAAPPRGPRRDVEVSIGYTPVPDSAPLHMAEQAGLFAKYGLRVKLQDFSKLPSPDPRKPGTLPDIQHLSWVFMFGAIGAGADWKIIGEAYQAVPGSTGLFIPEDSTYVRLTDRPRPRIAVNTELGLGTLLTNARLSAAGIPADDIEYKYLPFDKAPGALAKDQVDAAWLPEPFVTQYALEHGLQQLADTTVADTANFPLSGYACTAEFAEENPDVIRRFRAAMAPAQERAATDRAAVERVFRRKMGLSEMTTELMTIGTFPLKLEPARPQRVADLMFTYNVLPKRLDVETLVLPS